MKALRWLAERLKDLFYDPTNTHLDPGRVAAWASIGVLFVAAGWNVHLGKEIDLGATGFPAGLTALLGVAIIYITKDRKNAKT